MFSGREVARALDRMAAELTPQLTHANPVVVAVMHGGAFTAIELCKRFRFAHEFDYLHVTRYAGDTRGGSLNWLVRPSRALAGRTVLLVTHDMDEAMLLGTKIAVMDKGQLLQYAAPADIIARPATAFVDELIGTGDRPFRLLALDTVHHHVEPGEAPGDTIEAHLSLRDAYAEALWSGRDALPVVADGKPIGRITLATLNRLAVRPK